MPEVVRISELNAATALTGEELVPIVQDDTTVRTTVSDLSDAVVIAARTAQAQTLISSSQYRGSGSSFDNVGLIAMNADAGNGTAAGTITSSGTKGQALPRITGDSGTSAPGVGVDFYGSNTSFYRSGSGAGGLIFDALVMFEALLDTQCVFLGFCELNANAMFNLVTEPSQFSYIMAFAKDSTDGELQFMLRNNGTVTKIPLTGVTVAALVNHLLQVHIETSATEVVYELTDVQTGLVIASGSSSTEMPGASVKVYPHMAVQTKASGGVTAAKLGFYKFAVVVQP